MVLTLVTAKEDRILTIEKYYDRRSEETSRNGNMECMTLTESAI